MQENAFTRFSGKQGSLFIIIIIIIVKQKRFHTKQRSYRDETEHDYYIGTSHSLLSHNLAFLLFSFSLLRGCIRWQHDVNVSTISLRGMHAKYSSR